MEAKKLKLLLDAVLNKLEGDWLLVGGALLHALNISERHTLDIDLVPLHKVSNEDVLRLVEVAVANGFPPETINMASEYFVKKQKNWKEELRLLKKTRKAKIFRPSRKLFRSLKEARGSETDLRDIELFESKIQD